MPNKAFQAFDSNTGIEFWLDGEQKKDFVYAMFTPIERLKTASRIGVFKNIIIFYIASRLGLPFHKKHSEASDLVYKKIITSFLNSKNKQHTFRLWDKGKNIVLETDFEEKDAFLSVFRILDEYAKVVLINQYNLSQENIKDKIVIDGGSNLGEFAIYCARLGAKKVYAFEPLPTTYEMLKKQIVLNGLEEKIIPINKALGDKNENIDIHFSEAGDSSATICVTTKTTNSQKIEVVRLDDEITNEQVGLIKLDVDGYEEEVLLGAKRIIAADKPILALSAYHKPTDKKRLPELVLSIRPDYTIKLLQKCEPDFYCE